MPQPLHPIFYKSVFSVCIIIFLTLLLYRRADKEKESFTHIRGAVVSVEKTYQDLPSRDLGKYRYIQLDGYPVPFEVFIGKESGDFQPDLEQVDSLRVGDIVDIFYAEEDFLSEQESVNRLAYFIDRDDLAIFKKGSGWEKGMAYFLFSVSFLLLVVLIYLKRVGKVS